MMSKVWLVFTREYLSRVKKKSFILITLLTPLAFLLFFVVAAVIFSYKSDDKNKVAVVDPEVQLGGKIESVRRFDFEFTEVSIDEVKTKIEEGEYVGAVVLSDKDKAENSDFQYEYYSDEPLDLESNVILDRVIKEKLRKNRMKEIQVDSAVLAKLDFSVRATQKAVTEKGKDVNNMTGYVSAALGGIMGYIMFFVILFFGTQVMKSVAEEKVNRIVEIIISSVKPFELMLGKILGSSAVSLTQLGIWLILIPLISFAVQSFYTIDPAEMEAIMNGAATPSGMEQKIPLFLEQVSQMNWPWIIFCFLFYFICGFLIYASMFAAIGAALGDDINDGQTLTLPIVVPIVLAIYIMFQVVREPNSSLAIWSSIFPFFSCIIMPARIPYQPDLWQVGLSMAVSLGTALLMIWLSGRIYRVGILLYGKKASFKDLAKWVFSKDL